MKNVVRVEFARRLQAEMVRKGWNQSDLARQAAKHMPDKTFGRDLVSGYVRGRIYPRPVHLNAVAKALGVAPEDLTPPEAHSPKEAPFSMQAAENGRVILQINQIVDWPVALKIVNLLKGESNNAHDS